MMWLRCLTALIISSLIFHTYADVFAGQCPKISELKLNTNSQWQAITNLGTWTMSPNQATSIASSVDAVYSINASSILSTTGNTSAIAGQVECVYQNSDSKKLVTLISPAQPNKYKLILEQNGGSWALNADKQSAKCIESNTFLCAFTY